MLDLALVTAGLEFVVTASPMNICTPSGWWSNRECDDLTFWEWVDGYFLGGSLRPIGLSVSFLHVRRRLVLEHLISWRKSLGDKITVADAGALPGAASVLDPMEAPWTRELLLDCGEWTAYLNNGMFGGDSTAYAPAIATAMGVRLVTAEHAPRYGPGHASTQLSLMGPDGAPPLMYLREISAHAEDGRWTWHESGTVQPFEDVSRHRAKRIKDRLDRALLVQYLMAMGIDVDRPGFYGTGVSVVQSVTWTVRREAVSALRQLFCDADLRR